MEIKSDLSKCKKGDWVCTADNGWGRVHEIDNMDSYPICIEFEDRVYFYTDDGKSDYISCFPTCFPANQVPQPYLDLFGPPPQEFINCVSFDCGKKEHPEFKDGDPVWALDALDRHCGFNGWVPRIFKGPPAVCYGDCSRAIEWDAVAPWNGGVPPEEDCGEPKNEPKEEDRVSPGGVYTGGYSACPPPDVFCYRKGENYYTFILYL